MKGKGKKNESDSGSDEDDVVEDIEIKVRNPKQQRVSVSAEVYGDYNKKGNFKPIVIPKSADLQKRIYQRMSEAFMFNPLDEKEREIVMLAMKEKKVSKGEWLINQGEEGNVLYMVDTGELDCFKKHSGESQQKYLKTYQPGESFGELALLYNAPRAASIQAKTDCLLWELDRETFNHIVKDASQKKREKYEEFLKGWSILKSISDPYDVIKIADVIEVVPTVPKSQPVVMRGESTGDIYIVEEGEVAALDSDGNMRFKFGKNEYFGELPTIFKNQKQPLTFVVNQQGTKLLKISQRSYTTTLKAVESILQQNAQKKYQGLI